MHIRDGYELVVWIVCILASMHTRRGRARADEGSDRCPAIVGAVRAHPYQGQSPGLTHVSFIRVSPLTFKDEIHHACMSCTYELCNRSTRRVRRDTQLRNQRRCRRVRTRERAEPTQKPQAAENTGRYLLYVECWQPAPGPTSIRKKKEKTQGVRNSPRGEGIAKNSPTAGHRRPKPQPHKQGQPTRPTSTDTVIPQTPRFRTATVHDVKALSRDGKTGTGSARCGSPGAPSWPPSPRAAPLPSPRSAPI